MADAVVEAEDREAAVEAIATLLGTSRLGAEAVIGMSFDKFTKESRRRIADELDDLNNQLTFTLGDRPASTGEGVTLRLFAGADDRDIFSARTADMHVAGDGSGGPAGSLDDGIRSGLGRIDDEDAVWLVAVSGTEKVGMVFGELAGGEVNVRVWNPRRAPQEGLQNGRAAQVTLGDGELLPRGADGRPSARPGPVVV